MSEATGAQVEVVLVADQFTPPAEDLSCSFGGEAAVPDEQEQTGLEQGLFDRINRSDIAVFLLRKTEESLFFYILSCSQF